MKYELIIDKNQEEKIVVTVHEPSSLTDKIKALVENFSKSEGIIGTMDDEMKKLQFHEIECITIIDRKVIAIDGEKNHYRIKDTLRDLEEILPSYFIRINKSAIANEHAIKQFVTAFSGGIDAVFLCGYREYVSRRCFSKIKRRYEL